jgi:negative regulator of sigma E activity
MSEENDFEVKDASEQDYSENWREIGKNFKALGKDLATAFRQTWENEELREHLRASLDSLAAGINQSVDEAVESEQAKHVRDRLGKAAQRAQEAGTQTFHDIKPHMVSSLRQLNVEFQRMVERLEKEDFKSSPEAEPDDDETAES